MIKVRSDGFRFWLLNHRIRGDAKPDPSMFPIDGLSDSTYDKLSHTNIRTIHVDISVPGDLMLLIDNLVDLVADGYSIYRTITGTEIVIAGYRRSEITLEKWLS